jgi:hypothetical protein
MQFSWADEPGASVSGQQAQQVASSQMSLEARLELLEKDYQSMKATNEKAESRTYEIKMMSRELIRYIKAITIILALIGLGFPFVIWLLSKKRIIGLSGLSGEVAATLLVVEERQAKLANILKDIQGEIDYLHTMSVPDLKNLIQQAENYLKQNEQDLEKTGVVKDQDKSR